MSSSRKNIIFIVVLVAVAALALGGYVYLSGSASNQPLVTPDASSGQPQNLAGVRQDVLANIEAIKSIQLDTTILTDPAFLRLQKVVRPPVEDPGVGRPNPFLPYKAAPQTTPVRR